MRIRSDSVLGKVFNSIFCAQKPEEKPANGEVDCWTCTWLLRAYVLSVA